MTCFVCNSKEYTVITTAHVTMHKCNNCNAMWQHPLQNMEAYKDIYSEAYYRDIWGYSEETDNMVARSKKVMSKKFIRLLKKYKKKGKVLDVGCGLGYLLSFLQKDYDIYGVEISPFARKVALKRIGNGRIFSSLNEVAGKKFDAILFYDSFEHIPDQDKLFKDIDRLLVDNGKLFVVMPDSSSLTSKLMGKHWIEYKKDHVVFYSKKAFCKQLEKKGFVVDEIYSNWKTVTLYYLISYLSVFRLPVISTVLQIVEKILPSFALNIPMSFPIGQMTVVFSRR